jgi:AraC family transcriptional regulator
VSDRFSAATQQAVDTAAEPPRVLTTPDEWAQKLSAPAMQSSDPAIWPSALLRYWKGTSADMDQPVLDHHYIVQHLGGAKRVQRRHDSAPVSTVVENSSLTIVPAGTRYQWNTAGPIEFAHLYLSPTLLRQAALRLSATYDPHLIDRVGCADPLLQSVFTAMRCAMSLPAPDQALYLDGLLETFLLKLLRDHSTAKVLEPRARETLAPYRLKRVVEFVDAHLTGHISLAQLAGIADASVFHFSRAFKSSLGETPYQYILRRRVERAQTILTSSGAPLAQVAVASGFRGTRHLAKTFQRLTGVSPRRFRRHHTD